MVSLSSLSALVIFYACFSSWACCTSEPGDGMCKLIKVHTASGLLLSFLSCLFVCLLSSYTSFRVPWCLHSLSGCWWCSWECDQDITVTRTQSSVVFMSLGRVLQHKSTHSKYLQPYTAYTAHVQGSWWLVCRCCYYRYLWRWKRGITHTNGLTASHLPVGYLFYYSLLIDKMPPSIPCG